MRFVRLLGLYLQNVLEYRSRNFVYFIIAFLNPIMMLLFWTSAINKGGKPIGGFSLNSITEYYFLLIPLNAFLVSYAEDDISELDIKGGELVRYLLRPISYYLMKLYDEVPFRITQGIYGIIVLVFFFIFFRSLFSFHPTLSTIVMGMTISILAFFIIYTYKVCLGLLSFWFVDAFGFFQLMEVTMILFAGMVIPISIMSPQLAAFSNMTPFPYMMYYPITVFQGKLLMPEFIRIVGIQFIWLAIFSILYRVLWKKGIYKFTAVGQ